MKVMVSVLVGLFSLSVSASSGVRGFESFKCTSAAVKLSLVEGKNDDIVVTYAGLQKNYDLVENRYILKQQVENLPLQSYLRKENYSKILLSNPDNTYFDSEIYVIEIDGSIFDSKDLIKVKGTIQKKIVPYGIGRMPVISPAIPVTCSLKLSAK